jgi:hypothetical protein
MKQTMSDVKRFLAAGRVALVGVSRDEKHLSRHLWTAFRERDYDVIPVHPEAGEIEGVAAASSLREVSPPPEAALVMLSGSKAEQAVEDALAVGVQQIWVYGVMGPRDVDADLLERMERENVNFVAGFCPFMFLENAGFGHKLHGWIWKALGFYPAPH